MSLSLDQQLLFKPHNQIQALLASGAPVHVLINPVEYHGPHLSLGNDRILSERLALQLHQRLCKHRGDMPFIVGGIIDFGCDPTPGAGSVGVSYLQLSQMIKALMDGLIALKVPGVIFHTFHGSPFHSHAIHQGMAHLHKAGIPSLSVFDLVLKTVIEYDADRFAALKDCLPNPGDFDTVFPLLSFDLHAGFFETSVALHVAPETVAPNYTTLPPCPDLAVPKLLQPLTGLLEAFPAAAREIEHAAVAMSWMQLKPFPGYTSHPALATAAAGRFFVEDIILPLYEQQCLKVLWQQASAPPAQFPWLKPLAALIGGRI